MVLPLLARRVTLGGLASVAARTAHPATLAIVTRRTLFATPQFNFPPAQSTGEKTIRKRAEQKTSDGKRAAPAKRGRPPKQAAKPPKGKQPKQEKQRGAQVLHRASPELTVFQSAYQKISSLPNVHLVPTSFSTPLLSNPNPKGPHCWSSKSFPSVLVKFGGDTLRLRSKYVWHAGAASFQFSQRPFSSHSMTRMKPGRNKLSKREKSFSATRLYPT